jgi:hypothetical protein
MAHVDKCPVCGQYKKCHSPDCDPKLETADGDPMVYRTCRKCINKLGKESSGIVVSVPGYTKALME